MVIGLEMLVGRLTELLYYYSGMENVVTRLVMDLCLATVAWSLCSGPNKFIKIVLDQEIVSLQV